MATKQRKLRTKKLSFTEDDGDDEQPPPAASAAAAAGDGVPPPPPPPAAAAGGSKKSSSSSSKPAGSKKSAVLLSFGDDEEGGLLTAPSKSKKKDRGGSKFGRAPGAAAAGDSAAAAAAGSHASSAGEYSAERLAALHASTARLPDKLKPPAAAPAAPADGAFKLSGSFKAAKKPNDDRFSYSFSIHGTIGSDGPGRAAANGGSAHAGQQPGEQQQQQQQDRMPLPPPPWPPAGAGAAGGKPPSAAAAGGAAQGSESGGEGDDDFAVPDEETIKLAKAKRERLRQAHLAPDYLPLGGASKLLGSGSNSSGPAGGGSGGVRMAGGPYQGSDSGDEDEDAEAAGADADAAAGGDGADSDAEAELEERMRLAFVGGGTGAGRQQQQQPQRGARRGGPIGRAAAAAAMATGQYAATVQDVDDDDMADADDGGAEHMRARQQAAAAARRAVPGGGRPGGATAARGDAAIADAAAGVLEALQEAAARAAERRKQVAANVQRTSDNLAGALEEAERIKADIATTSAKYADVQALKAYLSDLADCLAAKGPLVEELCEALDGLRVEAAQAVQRQAADDEAVLFHQAEAAVTAALNILGTGGDAAAAAAAAQAAAAGAEEAAVAAAAKAAAAAGANGAEQQQQQQELDEFGRDVGLMRRKELAAGAGRRQQLVARLLAELAAMRGGAPLNLDAPLPSPAAAGSEHGQQQQQQETEALLQYQKRRQEALELAPTVFADADEQYGSLAAVKQHLEAFKAQHPREYCQAYLGESAAALFAPFVRLELLAWEPLPVGSSSSGGGSSEAPSGQPSGQQQQQQGFDMQAWYQQLFEYGLVQAGGDAAAAAAGLEDADANLVPQLVESLILPTALTLVERCWDPCDVPQSRALVALVSDLFVYVPSDRQEMEQLLALTSAALEAAAGSSSSSNVAAAAQQMPATVPPWPAAAAAACPLSQAVVQLRFRRAAGLLRSVLGFQELLSRELLLRLALGRLVAQQLVPCLRSSLGGDAAGLGVAVARAEAVVACLPGAWFAAAGGGGGPPREAQSLVEVVASLGRSVEQQCQQARSGSSGYARRVAALLQHLGQQEQAHRLSAAAAAAAAAGR